VSRPLFRSHLLMLGPGEAHSVSDFCCPSHSCCFPWIPAFFFPTDFLSPPRDLYLILIPRGQISFSFVQSSFSSADVTHLPFLPVFAPLSFLCSRFLYLSVIPPFPIAATCASVDFVHSLFGSPSVFANIAIPCIRRPFMYFRHVFTFLPPFR